MEEVKKKENIFFVIFKLDLITVFQETINKCIKTHIFNAFFLPKSTESCSNRYNI